MIVSLLVGVIVLMFAIIFIGGILLGVQLAGMNPSLLDRPTPSRSCREHAAEMAERSRNGLDGVHGPPRKSWMA